MIDSIIGFLRTPPGWLLALLLTYLVTHLIKMALKFPAGSFVPIAEFFLLVVIGILTAHVFLEPTLTGNNAPLEKPLYYICALGGFGLASIVLYLIDRKYNG